MRRKIIPVLVVAMAALLGLTLSTPASASNSPSSGKITNKQVANPNACYPVGGHFYPRWNADRGGFGCATTPENPYGNGSYQEFEHGEMDWSPSQGGSMVVSGKKYQYVDQNGLWQNAIYFQFGVSDNNYDSWLIRADYNGRNVAQVECWTNYPCGRTAGGWTFAPVSFGHYSFITEGCDVSGGHTCRQGWTLPVDIYV
jgi:hypothetical protein